MGAHLLYHLLQKYPKVRATHRASSDIESVLEVFKTYTSDPQDLFARIEWVEANITRLPELTQTFEGVSQVYHCAAFISFNPKHYKALQKANIEGTANIVNLCLSNGIKKLCHVSSIATLGEVKGDEAINETVLWNPEARNSVYSITKYGAEMEVWRGMQEGLEAVIVNPGVILGEGFWSSGSGVIIQQAAKGMRFYTNGGTGFVDVQDVVRAMIQLTESEVKNERFILVGENISYRDLSCRISDLFGNPHPKKSIPKNLLYLVSTIDGISSAILGTRRILLKATVRSLYNYSRYDSGKIRSSLNFEFTPLEKTLSRVVSTYRNSTTV